MGYLDSNQEKQDQNLLCYHYTIAQNVISNFVGLPGFEPRKTGPESVVLPLHHSPECHFNFVGLPGFEPRKTSPKCHCRRFVFVSTVQRYSFFQNLQSFPDIFLKKMIKKIIMVTFFRDVQKSKYICEIVKVENLA